MPCSAIATMLTALVAAAWIWHAIVVQIVTAGGITAGLMLIFAEIAFAYGLESAGY